MFMHISPAYVTIHTPRFEDKIQKSVPPPTHLTPALPFLFCLSMKQLSGFSPELTGEFKSQRPSDLDENTRILPLCALFFQQIYFLPHQGMPREQLEWVCPQRGWQSVQPQVCSCCSFIASFLPGSVPMFHEVLEVGPEPLSAATEQGYRRDEVTHGFPGGLLPVVLTHQTPQGDRGADWK